LVIQSLLHRAFTGVDLNPKSERLIQPGFPAYNLLFYAIVSAMMAAKTIKACIHDPAFEAVHLAQYDGRVITDYLVKVNRLRGFYSQQGVAIFYMLQGICEVEVSLLIFFSKHLEAITQT
jgi:hypothetical protein